MPNEFLRPNMLQTDAPLRPPLKWAGGKRWLMPHVRPLWELHAHSGCRLVEPFCGGLAVSLGLRPTRAILNDANAHLINFYKWLQSGLSMALPVANDEGTYYRYRYRFNELALTEAGAQSAEAAQLFYYLNRTGYNGLCRFNRAGEFNVPFGRYTTITYAQGWPAVSEVLREWDFTSTDFAQVAAEPSDFVYADPPYDTDFTAYSKQGFAWADQVRLAEWLVRHDGPAVASNQATPRIIALYGDLGFELSYLSGPRRISCTGDRTPADEILAVRNISAPASSPAPAPASADAG